ncbi:hypothetical protein [Bradyrhizobium sp. CCBAU 11386]|uniref:hypothetical protein n=1 Tax=Bradyrhizobium sp. CCBAU 11386 TaxID=1630837 RepID=UPI00230213ED|nr:hypothetical protein [Bradyrhizobium sp. CCBAU 11386]
MTTKRLTRFLFSTDALPPEDRLAIWLQDLGRHHMRLEIEPREPRANEPCQDDNDGFAFSWVRRSNYRILGEDETLPRDTDDSILLFYGAASSFAMEGCIQLTNVRLDGALFRSRIPDIDGQLLHRLPSNGTALRLLQAYVDALAASGTPADPLLSHFINEHIVDLIAVSLRSGDDNPEPAAQSAIPAARLAAAKTDIRAHLRDPALSARHVALRLGLSERYLSAVRTQRPELCALCHARTAQARHRHAARSRAKAGSDRRHRSRRRVQRPLDLQPLLSPSLWANAVQSAPLRTGMTRTCR